MKAVCVRAALPRSAGVRARSPATAGAARARSRQADRRMVVGSGGNVTPVISGRKPARGTGWAWGRSALRPGSAACYHCRPLFARGKGLPMTCLVTGCAGFIGSHLCERLLADGHRVVGVDCFTAYYPRPVKERNLAPFRSHPDFTFHDLDLSTDPLGDAVGRAEVVFHLAAMPGLNQSWTDFDAYTRHNLTATRRLLEAVRGRPLRKFVYASTSSVYGKYASGDESLPTRPSSPYGITKLAGEQMCRVYHDEFALPVVVLRYFSV